MQSTCTKFCDLQGSVQPVGKISEWLKNGYQVTLWIKTVKHHRRSELEDFQYLTSSLDAADVSMLRIHSSPYNAFFDVNYDWFSPLTVVFPYPRTKEHEEDLFGGFFLLITIVKTISVILVLSSVTWYFLIFIYSLLSPLSLSSLHLLHPLPLLLLLLLEQVFRYKCRLFVPGNQLQKNVASAIPSKETGWSLEFVKKFAATFFLNLHICLTIIWLSMPIIYLTSVKKLFAPQDSSMFSISLSSSLLESDFSQHFVLLPSEASFKWH